ncbi:hypothetical protein KAX02_05755 [candidate division WOR-3 bacterium]|nr:hypothetical protein [candidate division WOR-3 bacterium]
MTYRVSIIASERSECGNLIFHSLSPQNGIASSVKKNDGLAMTVVDICLSHDPAFGVVHRSLRLPFLK